MKVEIAGRGVTCFTAGEIQELMEQVQLMTKNYLHNMMQHG